MVSHIRKYFITGLLVILPLFISLYILFVIFQFIDGILGNILNSYFKDNFRIYIPGLGLILFLLIIVFFGFISIHFFGRKLHHLVDKAVSGLPVLSLVYPWIKKSFDFLFSENQLAFKQTVLVEYPGKGFWSIGFITNETFKEAREKTGEELMNIYIPLALSPMTGFVALIPRRSLTLLDISVKEAMKLVVSAGLLNPENIAAKGENKV